MTQYSMKPLEPGQRIESLDILRGAALFGILLVNMQYFNTPAVYLDILGVSWFDSAADRVAEFFIRWLAEGKFISIFSFLFGVGLCLQWQRAEEKGTAFVPLYVRRLLVLLGLGLIHGLFIWSGDILAPYAVLGFILLLLRRVHPRKLLVAAGILVAIPVVLSVVSGLLSYLALMAGEAVNGQEMGFFINLLERSREVYATGTFAEVTVQRAIDLGFMWVFAVVWLPLPMALFLLGFYTARTGIVQNLSAHRATLGRVARWGLLLGLPANLFFGAMMAWGMDSMALNPGLAALVGVAHGVGAPLLALGYMAALVLLLLNSSAWASRLQPLSAVGKMALTNYLMQSLIATFLFYGYGLGWYGQVGPALGLVITALIFGLQLLYSPWWMQRFRYGPVEWLWRSLTYGQRQPMARPAGAGQTS